jgi:hypothetical protein
MRHHLLPIVVAFLCTSFAAQAQQVGEYDGITADGSTAVIQVAQDPNNSNLEVKVISFGLTLDCLKSGDTLSDIGIGLTDGSDIVGHKFSYSTYNFYSIDLVTSMTFHGLNTVSGTVGGNLSAFNPTLSHDTLTKKVQACTSPKQTFTATFTGSAKHVIPPGAVQISSQPLITR